ncbi:MAG: ABC transporter permease, partial [Bacteroidetes bacterium]
FEVFLNLGNIILGVGLSVVIGVLSGIIPAGQAASMDPVVAIRS